MKRNMKKEYRLLVVGLNVVIVQYKNNGKVTVGAPAISGAQVSAQVERHLKGDKVLIFKKKRRKGYQKLNGFRASLTEIKITNIKVAKTASKDA